MKNQQWKLKYQDLKLKFHDAVDVSFRLGMEAGLQQAQVQQAQQQKAQSDAETAAMAGGGQLGQENEQLGQQDGQLGQQEPSDGSELDQHIGELESMVAKSELNSKDLQLLKSTINNLKTEKFKKKQQYDLFKSEQAIKAISKNIFKAPVKLNKAAAHNMSPHAKAALNDQEKIIDEVMKSFQEEDELLAQSIQKTLGLEQLLKE